ncbi:hypothetical protein FQA39_LY10473 [Lamprigera yunnana]|nr:hypothetical protein FQA39_LY10473 [Lamprigera yunnana]
MFLLSREKILKRDGRYESTIYSMRKTGAKLKHLVTCCDTFTSLTVSENSSRLEVHTESIQLLLNFEHLIRDRAKSVKIPPKGTVLNEDDLVNLTLFDDVDVDCGTLHSTPRREVVEVAGKSSAHNDLTTSFTEEHWSKFIPVYKWNLKYK